ncbi:MAG: FadR/GntR family transcriptional regulator [Bauldia sp.]
MADRQEGRTEAVAGVLGRRIVAGRYHPGEALPTEPEMQEEFGVSRTAVREAIRLLSGKGLTVSRPKIGTRVRPIVDWNLLDADVLRWQVDQNPSEEFIHALFEMREIVEPEAAARAVERATDEQVAALGVAMDGIRNHPRGSPEQVSADLDFHLVILESTRNPLLRAIGAMIESGLSISFTLGWRTAMAEEAVLQHNAVYEAIRDRDRERAFHAMRELLQGAKINVFKSIWISRSARRPTDDPR